MLSHGITKVNKDSHSKALSLLVYIPDTRFLIYYQYLYGAIGVDFHKCVMVYKCHNSLALK